MHQDPKVFISFTKTDQYLDLTYYKTKTKFWDGEVLEASDKSSLRFGDVLLPTLKHLDSLNTRLGVFIKVEGNNPIRLELMNITGQNKLKHSKLKSCRDLTSSAKEAKFLHDFIAFHDFSVI